MSAVAAPQFDAPLRLIETKKPTPAPGEVRIKVVACGVNFADTLLIRGAYQERREPPIIPGLEVSGVVDAVGDGAAIAGAPAQVGARVAAMCAEGMAEYVIARGEAATLLPEDQDLVEAAAMPIAYGTGLVALQSRAQLQPGERLVVTGAAGGVGLTAVEIGALLGAEVVAIARGAEKLALASRKGAHHGIDASSGDLRDALKKLGGVDVAYETVGGETWEAVFRAASPGARLLPIGFAGGETPQIPANILLVKNLTVIGFYWGGWLKRAPGVFGDALAQVFDWRSAGKIAPEVTALPFSRAEEGLELLRSRKATGKIVLTPN